MLIIGLYWIILYKLLRRKRGCIKYIRRWHIRPINQLRYRYGDYETLFCYVSSDNRPVPIHGAMRGMRGRGRRSRRQVKGVMRGGRGIVEEEGRGL